MRGRKTAANCESCMNYEYDDNYECYVCVQDLDEDEMVRFVQGERIISHSHGYFHKFPPFSRSHFCAFW